MREFFRYLCRGLLAAALLAPAAATPPAHAGDTDKQAATQKKLAAVKARIQALAKEQRQAGTRRDSINGTLADQAEALAEASAAVRESDWAIAANQQKLDALEKRRDRLKGDLSGQRDALADLLRAAYKIQPGSDLRLLLGDADMARLARALAYSRYFQHDRMQRIRRLLQQLAQLQQVEDSIAQQRKTLEDTRAERRQQLAQLDQARAQQQALLARVEARIKDQHQQMQQLERNRQSLQDLLEKLRDVFADIPETLPSDTPFAERRGKLPWPVHGKSRRENEGIHISAGRGTTVRAVAHGRVAYANWLRGYGLLVIIDHGNGWMSLYGGNESVLHHAGDWVNAGEPIATAGASAGDHAGVYFGLRHHGKAVNPLPWLSKQR